MLCYSLDSSPIFVAPQPFQLASATECVERLIQIEIYQVVDLV